MSILEYKWRGSSVIPCTLLHEERDIALSVLHRLHSSSYGEVVDLYKVFTDVYDPTDEEYLLFELEMGYCYPNREQLQWLKKSVEAVCLTDKISLIE